MFFLLALCLRNLFERKYEQIEMLLVASGRFGLFNYLQALTGLLIRLILVTRSFWLAA
jgi:hypothetical protein